MTLAPIDEYRPAITPQPTGNAWIELMRPAAELAAQIAQTDFVPAEFRNKPEAVAACILYGSELGLGPMVSLSKIVVIKGKPAPYAELGRALALAAGHEIWVEESTNTRVKICGKRKGSNHVQSATWTLDDVKKAGISNQNYARYPRQMLLARASAELVRAMCPDVLGGIASFAEEAVDIDDDTPIAAPVTATADKPKTTRRRRNSDPDQPAVEDSRAAQEAASASDEAAATSAAGATGRTGQQSSLQPTPPSEDAAAPDRPSDAQTKMAMASFTEADITDRTDRLAATGAFLDRKVDSWSTLTRSEASTVIDALERLKAGDITFNVDDNGWTVVHTPEEEF